MAQGKTRSEVTVHPYTLKKMRGYAEKMIRKAQDEMELARLEFGEKNQD